MKDKEKKMIELFARRDGWEECSWNGRLYKGLLYGYTYLNPDICNIPNYLEDDNAILRIVRGLDKDELETYIFCISGCNRIHGDLFHISHIEDLVQANTREMAEALYIALGGEE